MNTINLIPCFSNHLLARYRVYSINKRLSRYLLLLTIVACDLGKLILEARVRSLLAWYQNCPTELF